MIIGGTMPLGRCEILDGEGVRTQFVFLGPLLVPCDSVYGSYKAAFPVQRPMKSILYAYARWVVAPLAFVIACIANGGLGPAAVAVGIAWLALVFVAGRTFGEEARQRRVLASLVGHGAPPEILFRGTLQLCLDDLEKAWNAHGRTILSWRYLFPNEVADRSLDLYYALCRYDAALTDDAIMTNRARLAWERVCNATLRNSRHRRECSSS